MIYYYLGSNNKGFKSPQGAKTARTKYLRKHVRGIHPGEYKIVKIESGYYGIELPKSTE